MWGIWEKRVKRGEASVPIVLTQELSRKETKETFMADDFDDDDDFEDTMRMPPVIPPDPSPADAASRNGGAAGAGDAGYGSSVDEMPTGQFAQISDEEQQADDPEAEAQIRADDQAAHERAKARGKRAGLIVLVILLACAVIAGVGYFAYRQFESRQKAEALSACQSQSAILTRRIGDFKQQVAKAAPVQSVTSSQVIDGALLTNLRQDVSVAIPKVPACSASSSLSELRSQIMTIRADIQNMTVATENVRDDLRAIDTSKGTKAVNSARQELASAATDARTTYTSSEGRVADDSVRAALDEAIKSAESVARDTSATTKQVSDARTALSKAVTAVNDSVSTKQQQDQQAEERRRQEYYRQQQAQQQQQQQQQAQQDQQNQGTQQNPSNSQNPQDGNQQQGAQQSNNPSSGQ